MTPHTIERYCKAKDLVNVTKCKPTNWEKLFTNHITDKRKYPGYKSPESEISLFKTGYRANKRIFT